MKKEEYLSEPCSASALPFWKERSVIVPEHMRVVRDDLFFSAMWKEYTDELYFKRIHHLKSVTHQKVPLGFRLIKGEIADYARHIAACYTLETISEEALAAYQKRPTYHANLWLALADDKTGHIAASGIAEVDREIGEGILEWIQVSPEYRKRGLGEYVVKELLYRMKDIAGFVTVSGRVGNPTKPEQLYEKCGFCGKVLWHVLVKQTQ